MNVSFKIKCRSKTINNSFYGNELEWFYCKKFEPELHMQYSKYLCIILMQKDCKRWPNKSAIFLNIFSFIYLFILYLFTFRNSKKQKVTKFYHFHKNLAFLVIQVLSRDVLGWKDHMRPFLKHDFLTKCSLQRVFRN